MSERYMRGRRAKRLNNGQNENCLSCARYFEVGQPILEYDDGEYWPTFCFKCIQKAMDEANQTESSRSVREHPH